MNTTLSKFMSVAITVVIIMSLLYGLLLPGTEDQKEKHEERMEQDLQIS